MTTAGMSASRPISSKNYWRQIFTRNPDFCSWQSVKQSGVLNKICSYLDHIPGPLRVLDFGIGNMGLYRMFDDNLMRRIKLTGISESKQHSSDDPLLLQHCVNIEIGSGISPCKRLPGNSMDVVLSTYVFAYLDSSMRAETLAAFARVLAPGGSLVLVLHHPHGERERKFRSAEAYWPEARLLYQRLLEGRYVEAIELLHALTEFLNQAFGADEGFHRYLASYLKTAVRFLEMFYLDRVNAKSIRTIPDFVLSDCHAMQLLIDREWVMTCQSFQPIENPGKELALPTRLSLSSIVECTDPRCGSPIANVVIAIAR